MGGTALAVGGVAPSSWRCYCGEGHESTCGEASCEPAYRLTVDVPGSVEVELHKLDKTVATIQVQP
jgi:hypothetical protein